MSIESEIRKLVASIPEKRPYIRGEESTKDALIRPMIRVLGYDTWNPAEVSSEFTADFGTKQHEKVDFAIMAAGRPIILIECKTISSRLGNNEIAQLFRYFSVTEARFAILTNGVRWKFFTDLDAQNRMDEEPFLDVNLEHLDDFHLKELAHFAKGTFDEDAIRANIRETRVLDAFCKAIDKELLSPSPEFVKFFARKVYKGQLNKRMVEYFTPFVEEALQMYFDHIDEAPEWKNDLQEGDGEGPAIDPPLDKVGPEEARQEDARAQDDTQPDGQPDYSKYRNWEKVKANPELYSLFVALREYARSLGNDVQVNPTKYYISFKRKRTVTYVKPQTGKNRLVLHTTADLERTTLREGFTRELPENSHYAPCNLEIIISNQDDLERAKPLLKRSYDEAG